MIFLYCVRNAETTANRNSKLQGDTQGTLSLIGKKQAMLVGKTFIDIHFDVVYCSPLQRAVETYQGMNIDATPILLDELKERNFGNITGQKYIDAINKPVDYRPEGGESLRDVLTRSEIFLKRLIEKHEGCDDVNVLACSHHEFILCCVAFSIGLPLLQLRHVVLSNASITQLNYDDGKWCAKRINEIGHLGDIDTTKKFD